MEWGWNKVFKIDMTHKFTLINCHVNFSSNALFCHSHSKNIFILQIGYYLFMGLNFSCHMQLGFSPPYSQKNTSWIYHQNDD
jgi:hypothetical protein